LIDPDRPPEIARAILRLLSDESLAQRLGAEGRKRVLANYSVEAVLPRLTEYYAECIRSFGGRERLRLCSSQ
jgi:glycosyltransferase involved in cell wall biosynthesis